MKEAYAECHRKFHPIKQAIALASCENRSLAPLRSTMRDPDLMDQELAYNLVLAEKVQKGRMSPIEKEAAAAQFHSQILTNETKQRSVLRTACFAPSSEAKAYLVSTKSHVRSEGSCRACDHLAEDRHSGETHAERGLAPDSGRRDENHGSHARGGNSRTFECDTATQRIADQVNAFLAQR